MADKVSKIPVRRKLLYSLVATVLFLACLEGIARLIEPRFFPWERNIPVPAPVAPGAKELQDRIRALRAAAPPDAIDQVPVPLREDPERGWSLPPNTKLEIEGIGFRFNSSGMRGGELPELEPGEVRLFTLGDSSVFGASVGEHEVFSTVASGYLSRAWGRKVVGVIGAVPGHDSSQSLKTLNLVGEQVKPAWVVVGNLWSDVYRADGAHSVFDDLAYLPPMKQRLRGYALYRILWQLLSPWLHTQQVKWIESTEDIGSSEDGAESRVPLEEYISNLKAIAKRSSELGARVAFLVLPAPMDLDSVPPPVTVQAYRYAMRRIAEANNAPLVDGPKLFKDAKVPITYFLDNVHPSPEGHRLLGQALAQALIEVGPPPEGKSQ